MKNEGANVSPIWNDIKHLRESYRKESSARLCREDLDSEHQLGFGLKMSICSKYLLP